MPPRDTMIGFEICIQTGNSKRRHGYGNAKVMDVAMVTVSAVSGPSGIRRPFWQKERGAIWRGIWCLFAAPSAVTVKKFPGTKKKKKKKKKKKRNTK